MGQPPWTRPDVLSVKSGKIGTARASELSILVKGGLTWRQRSLSCAAYKCQEECPSLRHGAGHVSCAASLESSVDSAAWLALSLRECHQVDSAWGVQGDQAAVVAMKHQ